VETDVVIVGKGIAAMVLAFLLKQKGIDHIILDRKAKPKHFDLAETLPPSALPLLQSIGLLKLFEKHSIRKTYGYHSLWGSNRLLSHNFYFHQPFKYGLKINKKEMIHQLQQLNQSPECQYEQSIKLKEESEGVTISFNQDGEEKTIYSKMIIDATGRNRAILKLLQIPNLEFDDTLSFSCHLPKKKHPDLKHDVFVESFKEGWGLVSGLGETYNVVSIFSNQQSPVFGPVANYQNWKEILKETKYLKHALSDNPAIKVTGRQSNSSRPEKISGPFWLAVGDAALAFDPLSSHGVSNAIYTATKAADSIGNRLNEENELKLEKNSFASYHTALIEIFDAYLKSRTKLYQQETRWKSEIYWREFF